jgi:methyl-accepting chemotaxis protein
MINLKDMRIRTKLIIGFGIVINLLILIAVIAAFSLISAGKTVNDITAVSIPQKDNLAVITRGILSTAWHMRDAMLASGQQEINKHIAIMQANPKQVTEAYEQIKASLKTERGRQLYADVLEKRKAYNEVRGPIMEFLKAGKQKEAIVLKEKLDPLLISYVASVTELDKAVNAMANEKTKKAGDNTSNILMVIIALTLIALTLSTVVTIAIIRSVTGPINNAVETANKIAEGDLTVNIETKGGGETGRLLHAMKLMLDKLKELIGDMRQASVEVAAGSEELSSSSVQITRTMDSQSGRATQIAASSEEMSQTIIDIAKNASNIASAATDTVEIARKGAEVVDKSVVESKAISATVNSSAVVMQTLGAKSQQIGEIISVIEDIADQTNLLALNAAIEAARAGEQGRGFAVVADEVRKLAERTAKATAEIGSTISSIQVEVDHAVKAMHETTQQVENGLNYSTEAGKQLEAIVNSVSSLQDTVLQIASATEEMAKTSESISGDIQEIAGDSKEMSSDSDKIAQSSSELARLAGNLRGVVEKFRLD